MGGRGRALVSTRMASRRDRLQGRLGTGAEQVGAQHLDTVATRIGGEGGGRVEAHRLRPQQTREERPRVVQLDPRARIDEQRERQRMRLREAEVRERLDLRVEVVGILPHEVVAGHPLVELLAQRLDALDAPLRTHRTAKLIGILTAHLAHRDRHLHELLLEHRDAERALEHGFELRVGIGDGLASELAANEGVDGATLDGSGADERDLHDEVVEPPRLQPRQQPHLRARLDLEHPDRVGPAQHVVDGLLLLGDRRELPFLTRRLADEIEAVLQGRQHPESQEVELDEPHPGGVVFVPLDDRAVLHARVLDRHDLADGPVGQHHSAGVDAEMAGRLQQLGRVLEHLIGDVVAGARLEVGAPALDLLGPGILLPGRMAERLRHVAHGVLGAVLDDVRDLGSPLAAVLRVDPLDDLFAPIGIEVDVDIGLFVAQRRQEALERQVVGDRVDGRDVEQVADGAVGGGAAPLTQDAAAPRLLHDAVDDQEVAREVLHLDDSELALDARLMLGLEVGVLARHRLPHESPQPRHRRVPLGDLLLGKGGLRATEREGELVGQGHGARDRPRVAREALGHLCARPQVRPGMGGKPAVQLIEAAIGADGRDRRGEMLALRDGVVHVVRREEGQPALGGERREHVVVARVERIAVVDELDVDGILPEQRDEPIELARGAGRTLGAERVAHGALAASRQHRPLRIAGAARAQGEVVEVVEGPALLGALQLRVREGRGEPVVPLLAAREHEKMRADRIGLPRPRRRRGGILVTQRKLRAERRLDLERLGGLREADDPVEPVVVRDRQRVEAETLGLFGELFGRGRPVEERERRMRVQLGIRDDVGRALDRGRGVGAALVRPRGAVAAVGSGGHVAGAAAVAEDALELGPRHRGIVEAHRSPHLRRPFSHSGPRPSSGRPRR